MPPTTSVPASVASRPGRLLFGAAVLGALIGVAPLAAAPAPAAAAEPQAGSAPAAAAQVAPQPQGAVRGKVSAAHSPLGRATVFAYELARLTVQKVTTGTDGAFHFDALPAGVYKMIAFKPGYEPAVVMLSRAAAEALQFVELDLAQEHPGQSSSPEDFWAVRDQIPPDVLRDLEGLQLADLAAPSLPVVPGSAGVEPFRTSFRASTGVQDSSGGASQLAGGGIGMEGRIGSMKLGVDGQFWRLEASPDGAAAPGGQAAALAVRMDGAGEGQIDVTTVSQRLDGRGAAFDDNADFERYRVSWSQPLGERSRSHFAAQYTSQTNFLRPVVPVMTATDSRAINLEGSYSIELSDRSSMETGVRFRERDGGARNLGPVEPDRAVELFGRGGWRLQPSLLVEYGLFTQMRDGSFALAPQGGVVFQLGDRWQAVGTVSQRIESSQDQRPLDGFVPIRFATIGQDGAGMGCNDLEQHCYRMLLARQTGDGDDLFSIAAVHREVGETLHLYFDDDFLNQFESLYLVQGDQLPELQMVLEHRIAPRVVARFESSYASGGGGVLYALDVPASKDYHPAGQHAAYENRVRYLVTSLDTHFLGTSTGVFLAFHRLAQGVDPYTTTNVTLPTQELERLQLMLSQDLSVLMRLAADWSVHLNFEVARGSLPFTLQNAPADELRRRVTGGLTVKF